MSDEKHYEEELSCSVDSRSTFPVVDRTISDMYQDELQQRRLAENSARMVRLLRLQSSVALERALRARHRMELPVGINGTEYSSIADTGAAENIMDLDTVRKLGLPISIRPDSLLRFSLCDGKIVRSIGKTVAQVTFAKGAPTPTQCSFYVLKKCAVPLIMGKKFLESTETLTKFKHRLRERLATLGRFSRILEIGSSSQRLSCRLDGRDVLVNPDSGSEINVMSSAFAKKHGYYHQRSTHHGRVVLGDGSEAETIGVITASVILGSRHEKSYQEVFHILPGLSSDILLGEDILHESDAFSQFADDFIDVGSESDLFHLNVLRWKGLIETKCLKSLRALSRRRQGQSRFDLNFDPYPKTSTHGHQQIVFLLRMSSSSRIVQNGTANSSRFSGSID